MLLDLTAENWFRFVFHGYFSPETESFPPSRWLAVCVCYNQLSTSLVARLANISRIQGGRVCCQMWSLFGCSAVGPAGSPNGSVEPEYIWGHLRGHLIKQSTEMTQNSRVTLLRGLIVYFILANLDQYLDQLRGTHIPTMLAGLMAHTQTHTLNIEWPEFVLCCTIFLDSFSNSSSLFLLRGIKHRWILMYLLLLTS